MFLTVPHRTEAQTVHFHDRTFIENRCGAAGNATRTADNWNTCKIRCVFLVGAEHQPGGGSLGQGEGGLGAVVQALV